MITTSLRAHKSLDGVYPPARPEHFKNHRAIRKFIKGMPSRGQITDTHASLVILNEADPCKSYILVEHFVDGMPAETGQVTIERMLAVMSWYATNYPRLARLLATKQPKRPIGGDHYKGRDYASRDDMWPEPKEAQYA